MTTEIYSLHDLKLEGNSLTAKVSYDPSHKVFEGHFPGNPIVPGVCSLNMITDLVQDQIGEKLMLKEAANVKFLQLIRPADQPVLKLSWKDTEGGVAVQASLESEGVVQMRFSGSYANS